MFVSNNNKHLLISSWTLFEAFTVTEYIEDPYD
jgi:hypothetical protein